MPYVKPGDRVRMTGLMPDDPSPLPIGWTGTVTDCEPEVNQIYVDWDVRDGETRSLILLYDDPFEVI